MSYTALYRNYRPLKFSDMVGQEHITRTLKNQVIADRVGHAYLFTGGRGTGKTTSAKILARVVNCLNPKDGEPCNECEICKEILDGSLTDVVEMDAASNNSVDDIRSIRDEVNFLPTKAKYRVYIIDEVHMLSAGAFNALLKTLEEPPEHVKFILATTEPQKLPMTILSRCQRFDFKRIPESDIIKRLKIICKDAKINIDEDALKTIAVLSEGHMRDAISILERCSQESTENITINQVKELVGLPSLEHIKNLAEGILSNDSIKSLDAIDNVLKDGKDLYNFLWEVIKYFKDILVYKATNKIELYSEEEIKEIKKLAEKSEKQRLLDIIYNLSELENDIKWSSQKTIMFQTGVIKLCQEKETVVISTKPEVVKEPVKPEIKETPKEIVKEPTKTVNTVEQKSGVAGDVWKKVIGSLKTNGKIRLYTCLISSRINEINDLVWEVEFPNGLTDFNKRILEDINNKNDLMKEIFKLTGKEIHLRYKDLKESSNKTDNNSSTNSIGDLGININIIE